METLDYVKVEMYAVALLIVVSVLWFTFLRKRTDKMQNKFFIVINTILLINISTSIISECARTARHVSTLAYNIMDIMEYLYFVFHAAMCPFFALYVVVVVGRQRKPSLIEHFMLGSVFVFTELIALSNPFTHWMYTFDENLDFKRCWGVYSLYISAILYFALSMFMLFSSWRAITRTRRRALIYFFCVVSFGVIAQLFIKDLMTELLAESISLVGVMIAIENEDDRIDIDTGFYNRKALQSDINGYIINRREHTVICIKITNPEIIQRTTGSQNIDILSYVLADFLKSVVPRYCIYNATHESFILTLFDKSNEDINEITDKLLKRFDEPFDIGENEVRLDAEIIVTTVPGKLKTAKDVLAMADQPVPEKIDKKLLTSDDLDYLLRRFSVEEAVKRGLKCGGFEVYYQPTYHVSGKLHGAEALIRLHDTELGNVYPDEFIPVAEQLGIIGELDNFVFSEVSAFLKSGIPQQHGMECINVNLSVMHCMQPGFIEEINVIAEKAGIDKSTVNFEITESVAASDYNVLSEIMNALKSEGYQFSMDDYGTGYSNMESIFSLDFDIIKIDKSILWSAEKSNIGRIILENTIHMIRQMQRKILVEGVETRSQVELLDKLGVDYLQGYFFSRPVPKLEFMKVISKSKAT